jgi:hypothetical protein
MLRALPRLVSPKTEIDEPSREKDRIDNALPIIVKSTMDIPDPNRDNP